MSKILVYVMDKLVWTLIVTVILSQVLQIAGVVDPPRGIELGEITYEQGNEYEYRMSVGEDGESREKRQAGDRSPLIDNLFNIPIATLNAVNNLVQSSRPALRRLREYTQNRLETNRRSTEASSRPAATLEESPPAAATSSRQQRSSEFKYTGEGPEVQEDGSSSRVLLRI